MRWVICALAVLALPPSALAGDFDLLRGSELVGSPTYMNWSGFYVGGTVGYGSANADFSASTFSIIADVLRVTTLESQFSPASWTVLGTANDRELTYGGFVGYNTQWQDVILGIEANYNEAKFALTAPVTPIGRITPADSNGNIWNVAFTGSGTMTNLNYGTLRTRAGWVFGNFLPYGFIGFVLGEADVSVSSMGYAEANPPASGACSSSATPPCYIVQWDKTNSQTSLMYGFAVGGGVDIAFTQNIFVRGEYEYDRFAGISGIVTSIAGARVGAGVKF